MATEDYWADPVIDRELTPLGRYTQRGHNLREPVRWASEPVEGCYPKATGSEAHRTGQFTFG